MEAVVYTWSSCGHCREAKALLARRGIAFREVVLDGQREELRRLQGVFGRATVPLILLDGEPVAGLDALREHLDER